MDAQLRSQLAQTIYVASASTVDNYGQVTYGSPAAVKARVEDERAVSSGSRGGVLEVEDGEERGSSVLIITETAIALSDRIWLPGDNQADPTLARRPVSVLVLPDARGAIDHYETQL